MIADFIKDQLGDVATFDTDLFVSQIPDKPDNVICLYDETGIVTDYQSDYGSDWMGLLVMTRGGYVWASGKIWEIHNKLTGMTGGETDDFSLTTTMTQSNPAQIEVDKKGRRVFTAHYLFLVAQKNNTNRIPI